MVCVGNHTRLAGKITGFSKRYEAIIAFGTETDTLEYTGNRVKQGNMPVKFKGINAYKGTFTYNFKISKIDVNKLDISLNNSYL